MTQNGHERRRLHFSTMRAALCMLCLLSAAYVTASASQHSGVVAIASRHSTRFFSLNALLKASNIPTKSGSGLDAVEWFQTGQIDKLIAYNRDDCVRLAQLCTRDEIELPGLGTSTAACLNYMVMMAYGTIWAKARGPALVLHMMVPVMQIITHVGPASSISWVSSLLSFFGPCHYIYIRT